MTKQEQAEKEQKAFKWMQNKGYDRRACKEIAPTLVKYLEEQLILSGITQQRELLIAFQESFYEGIHDVTRKHIELGVDKYLSNL